MELPGGAPTRSIGPFVGDTAGPDRSLFLALHNRAKQSVVIDLDDPGQADRFAELVGSADILLESGDAGYLDDRGPSHQVLAQRFPHLVRVWMTAFGDTGPWSGFKGSDLVHLARWTHDELRIRPRTQRALRSGADRPAVVRQNLPWNGTMADFTLQRDVLAVSHLNVVVADIDVATEFYGTLRPFAV